MGTEMTAWTSRDRLLLDVGAWAHETFPTSTDHSRLVHLARELEELRADPSDGEEMADLAILLAHHAYMHGVDLLAEVERKMATNRRRQWNAPDSDGVVEHIR